MMLGAIPIWPYRDEIISGRFRGGAPGALPSKIVKTKINYTPSMKENVQLASHNCKLFGNSRTSSTLKLN